LRLENFFIIFLLTLFLNNTTKYLATIK
jgi:hypothetical protein